MTNFDLNKLTYLEFMDYVTAVETMDNEKMIPYVNKAIVTWDYEVSVDEGLNGLPNFLEVSRVIGGFLQYTNDFKDSLDNDNTISVKFEKWTLNDWYEYQNALKNRRYDTAIDKMREVCTGRGVDKNPLAADTGLRMWSAIQKSYVAVITGKL